MPPHIFPQDLRLNADGYIDLLATVVKPWIETVANRRPYVWQQDSAPCHTAVKTRQWLTANFDLYTSTDVWPPSSPDLNHMDYFVWGTVDWATNRASCNTKAELVVRIKAVFAAIPRDLVVQACAWFRKRMQAAIDAKGGTSNTKCGKHASDNEGRSCRSNSKDCLICSCCSLVFIVGDHHYWRRRQHRQIYHNRTSCSFSRYVRCTGACRWHLVTTINYLAWRMDQARNIDPPAAAITDAEALLGKCCLTTAVIIPR
ncbi:uncharacterized protein LOC121594277 [Anopheles merus]|uniref:uncharacterized protein LOC121594277 n=1 Tax=Anopheles merus TaxID=30066 RepID=UPI001BE489B7|nr:uncharacterized protein LOC121594277 [Anopheles merus]